MQFYQHLGFFPSPPRSPCGIPSYAENLAIEFVIESSDSSLYSIGQREQYDDRVIDYFDVSARDDIESEYCSISDTYSSNSSSSDCCS